MKEEYLSLSPCEGSHFSSLTMTTMLNKWTLLDYGTLIINTDVAFLEGSIGIAILVRNHLGIPLLAKVVPHFGCYSVDYRNF